MGKKLVFVWTIILVLGAGLMLGRLSARLEWAAVAGPQEPGERHGPRESPASWEKDLGLTADQQKQMDDIWKDLPDTMGKFGDQRRAMDKDRDQAIRALLNEQQLVAYDKIGTDYRARREDLDLKRRHFFEDHNQRSRAILTDDQKKIWDDMVARMRRPGTTMPSTQPSRNDGGGSNGTANPPGVTGGNSST